MLIGLVDRLPQELRVEQISFQDARRIIPRGVAAGVAKNEKERFFEFLHDIFFFFSFCYIMMTKVDVI